MLDIRNKGEARKLRTEFCAAIAKIVKNHPKIHTIYVSEPINIPNICVVVDNVKKIEDLSLQLSENPQYVNFYWKVLNEFLLLACDMESSSNSGNFPLVKTLLKLGADPNYKRNNSHHDPWKPFYPELPMESTSFSQHSPVEDVCCYRLIVLILFNRQ